MSQNGIVLTGADIEAAVDKMATDLIELDGEGPWAVVGIRRGGEELARRLAKKLEAVHGVAPELGMVDITLYRDDGFGPHDWPRIGPTTIEFPLREYVVVLVDDVLYTGRTVRSAMGALLDYGRPRMLRLAVLVDRGLRELPIEAQAVGTKVSTTADQHVEVSLEGDTDEQYVRITARTKGGQ